MKSVSLLRHGQAEASTYADADYERILTDKGRKDIFNLAYHLAGRKAKFDAIIYSPSARTAQTFEVLNELIHVNIQNCIHDQLLYNSSQEMIMKTINELPETFRNVLVIGHNPSITNFANHFSFGFNVDFVPPGGLISFNIGNTMWKEVGQLSGKYDFHYFPKT